MHNVSKIAIIAIKRFAFIVKKDFNYIIIIVFNAAQMHTSMISSWNVSNVMIAVLDAVA